MLSKIDVIRDKILADISRKNLRFGDLVPSRHHFMERYGCARATVDSAIKELVKDKFLYSVKGSGTYVAKRDGGNKLELAYIVDDFTGSRNSHGELALLIASGVQELASSKIIHPDDVKLHLRDMCRPGRAVIWLRPGATLLAIMKYLDNSMVPQLQIGRTYPEFSYVSTDASVGIRQGLLWLKETGASDFVMITEENNPMLPYLAERQLAFHQACVELGLKVAPEGVFPINRSDQFSALNEVGQRVFGDACSGTGIFTPNIQFLLPLLTLAISKGKRPGEDFHLLCFDHEESLGNTPGICMLRQRWGRMGRLAVDWFRKDAIKNKRMQICIEPKIIIGGQSNE